MSVEFRAVHERQDAGIRVIEDAVLSGIGIVRAPAYGDSRVEARQRNPKLTVHIAADRNLACRCAGPERRLARYTDELMQRELDKTFDEAGLTQHRGQRWGGNSAGSGGDPGGPRPSKGEASDRFEARERGCTSSGRRFTTTQRRRLLCLRC